MVWKRRCGTCRWWEQQGARPGEELPWGHCYAEPPRAGSSMRPIVANTDRCRHWDERLPEQQEDE